MMKYKIVAILMLSLMLSMLLMPLAVAADDGKSIIKEMVQAPADYSVGNGILSPYGFYELLGRGILGYGDAYGRIDVYYPPNWAFLRLPIPPPT